MDRAAYEDKRQSRYTRYSDLADKAKAESEQAYDASNKATEGIPFGQPILVGHHSESAHRRAIKTAHAKMDRCVELTRKAEHYKDKADGILNNDAISSDDPDAVTKLEAKLKGMQEQHDIIKGQPHESWQLSNSSGNMRRVKLRIEQLKRQATVQDTEKVINGITVKIDTDINRVQLLFPNRPAEETRTRLKQNGFRWSPYNQAWQRMITDHAIWLAEDIAKDVGA